MTNFTKKRTTGNDSGSDAPLSASDQDPQTLEELLERNKELERRLRKYKGQFYPPVSTILTFSTR
jgi:hypothetical protein